MGGHRTVARAPATHDIKGMARFVPQQVAVISPREHHEWSLKVWRRMDRDRSESVTRSELDCEEFRAVVRSVLAPNTGASMGGNLCARSEMNMTQAMSYCLRKADLNGDHAISFEEFKAFLLALRQARSALQSAHLIFALFDLDGDQHLSEFEFREMYRFYLGHQPTEVELKAEWVRLDVSGEQKASREAYIRWLYTSDNPIFRQHAPMEVTSMPGRDELPQLHRSASGGRPLWNQRFNTGVSANEGRNPATRAYFSRPQSLPELSRHYETHRGFDAHKLRMSKPDARKKSPVLSTDNGSAMLPARARPGGRMRSTSTGRLQLWEDHWQTPLCLKSRYQPGTLDLRCPGPPPRQLYDDWD